MLRNVLLFAAAEGSLFLLCLWGRPAVAETTDPGARNCTGDLVFDACHSACPRICGEPEPVLCVAVCVAGCGCSDGAWRETPEATVCYGSADECPAPTEHNCTGDLVYGECHSACPNVCGREPPEPALCPAVCVEGCACPDGAWRHEDECFEEVNDCPVGGDRDEHGCIGSAGYVWCPARRECVRPWLRPCDCETLYDANDNCIAAGCVSWFDGCNSCGVDWDAGEVSCTEMACEKLEDSRCDCYLLDAYENCVEPDGCLRWYDGCNTCRVLEEEEDEEEEDEDGEENTTASRKRLVDCTERYCETPDAPRCECATLVDANGHCVEENCESWYDGCNDCGVVWDDETRRGTFLGCTRRACFTLGEPKCNECASGLVDFYGRCVPTHCDSWYDGCNECGIDWDTGTLGPCTERACSEEEDYRYDEPRCGCAIEDARGNCVEGRDECESWFDGCQTCRVRWDAMSLTCTRLETCATPDGAPGEPGCNPPCESGVLDAYGQCVPEECEVWNDGCNSCVVDWSGRSSAGVPRCEPDTDRACTDVTEPALCEAWLSDDPGPPVVVAAEEEAEEESSSSSSSKRVSERAATAIFVVVALVASLVLAGLCVVAARLRLALAPNETTPLTKTFAKKTSEDLDDHDDAVELTENKAASASKV